MNEDSKISKENPDFKCDYCGKQFAKKFCLKKHIECFCSEKKRMGKEKEDIFKNLLEEMKEQKEEIRKLKQQISILNVKNAVNQIENSGIIQKDCTNNIQNAEIIQNINLIAFGKENLTHFTENEVKHILDRGFLSVPEMVRQVHFNKNKPEYHNVYISNLRDKYAITYDGNKWQIVDKNDVLTEICENKVEFLEEKFKEFYDSLPISTKKKFQRFLNEEETDTGKKNTKEKVKKILYNENNIPIQTREKIEHNQKIQEQK